MKTQTKTVRQNKHRTASGRFRNDMTLKEAILKVTARKPKHLNDILLDVQKLGYRFSGVRPANSVGAYLYGRLGRKVFKENSNCEWSPKAAFVSK